MKNIEMDDNFFCVLCVSLRYAIGRDGYVPRNITDYILKLKKDIPTRFLNVMKHDIEYDESDYLGDELTARMLDHFYIDICNEIKERGDDDDCC